MRPVLTGLALVLCASAQPAFAAWRYAPQASGIGGAIYWSTDVRRNGDEASFDSIEVYRLGGAAAGVLVYRQSHKVDCAWGVGRTGSIGMSRPAHLEAEGSPRAWGRVTFLGDPRDPDTLAGFACAAKRLAQPSDQTLVAAVKDGILRQGLEEVETAYKVDTPPPLPIPPYRRTEEAPPAADPAGPLDLVWTGQARAVFISTSSLRRQGDKATGASMWVTGVGGAAKEQAYLLKDFMVDCRSGAVAHSVRDSWPRREDEPKNPSGPLRDAVRTAGSPEDALVVTACGARAPMRQIGSTGDLPAFAAAPN